MRKFALALAATAAMVFTAPAFAYDGAASPKMQLAQADVKIKVKSGDEGMTRKKVVIKERGDRDMSRKKVIIRHGDRGRHEGWRHRDSGMKKTVIIKKRGDGDRSRTVIKKFD